MVSYSCSASDVMWQDVLPCQIVCSYTHLVNCLNGYSSPLLILTSLLPPSLSHLDLGHSDMMQEKGGNIWPTLPTLPAVLVGSLPSFLPPNTLPILNSCIKDRCGFLFVRYKRHCCTELVSWEHAACPLSWIKKRPLVGGWLNTSSVVISIGATASVRYREVVHSWEGPFWEIPLYVEKLQLHIAWTKA